MEMDEQDFRSGFDCAWWILFEDVPEELLIDLDPRHIAAKDDTKSEAGTWKLLESR